MSLRIWYNRTFSTASHYVEMIRRNADQRQFEIYVTHPKTHSLMLQIADYAEPEPTLPLYEYPGYCLDFCKKHNIDIFIPHFGMSEIVKYRSEFAKIGTKLLAAGDAELIGLVLDKGKLFSELSTLKSIELPDYYVVSTVDEFKEAYHQLKERGHRVCFKPASGEGGAGFRIIKETLPSIQSLYDPCGPGILLDEAIRMLSSVPEFPPLMVMEFMSGHEYSIDCLASSSSLLAAVPRKKVEGRVRLLEENELLIEWAHEIHKVIPLQYNFNIQVIYQKGKPKLLEINPRTSGGLYTSCLTGINFPYLAVKLLLGDQVVVPEPEFGIVATHIEKEMIMHRSFQ
ncbi:ATP-grasp domain-containing protein [Paenibacillus sp. P96]|uniref:ATP-grasp domain-containing protein n=1 Tax=Paenibacillus zeirhizosphaerae TaxID=2987519 RepID=A0ABT9FTJ1_9BACL|nr:ATP-grasp domain-containing protein [Paenibacillus sp. P96]MDP4098058.1 ATP-grasp domain-containing protein [Paenibacillus sp. P96]